MKVVITGADGFIGKNLRLHLSERGFDDVVAVTRDTADDQLTHLLSGAKAVFHLAGVNRPEVPSDFQSGNVDVTQNLCDRLSALPEPPHIVLASSAQAVLSNPYGESKRKAEAVVQAYGAATGARFSIARLTNVFGKWSRPNYNSAIATFCHNLARGLPITVNDPAAPMKLVYIDDVVQSFANLIGQDEAHSGLIDVQPVYETTVGGVAETIRSFVESRQTLITPEVGTGLVRALHATYLSFLEPDQFAYDVPIHADSRGSFVEMLKTCDSGQISYFTANPGMTRGEHYHHTKTEKFLVVKGLARFGFRQIVTGERVALTVRGGEGHIVETIPGWAHNVTNVGDDELIVLLWANEIFVRSKPDTIASKVGQ